MTLRIGYKASAEQFAPGELADYVVLAEQAGFTAVFLLGALPVLGVTAVLVSGIPSRTALASQAVYSATAQLGTPADRSSANLVIDPARTGPTTLHLYLLDEHGRPDDDVESVEVQLTQSELGIGPIDTELHRAGPGHFLVDGTLFTVPGEWTVTIRVRVDEFTEHAAQLKVEIRS